jgi:hypothetical protein
MSLKGPSRKLLQPDDGKLWDRPSDSIPQIPEFVTDLSDVELMNLFATYVAWQNYIDEKSVDLEIEEIRLESAIKIAEARVIASSGSTQVAKAKAAAANDSEVKGLYDDFIVAQAQSKALSIQQTALERSANFVSRELTRRVSRGSSERRDRRWNP